MSQSQSLIISELRVETERLHAKVENLRKQLAVQENDAGGPCADQDLWNVWPYSWAQSGWETTRIFCAERFHSFHGNLRERRLQRRNIKLRARAGCSVEAGGLRLV